MNKVQVDLLLLVNNDCDEDPFADIVPEEEVNIQEFPLEIADE